MHTDVHMIAFENVWLDAPKKCWLQNYVVGMLQIGRQFIFAYTQTLYLQHLEFDQGICSMVQINQGRRHFPQLQFNLN